MNLTPFFGSPLGGGLLTGKYGREMLDQASRSSRLPDEAPSEATEQKDSDGRLNGDNPFGGMLFTERNFDIVDALREVADELGQSMAQVALAWTVARPGVSSVLVGASRAEQLTQNIASLDVTLSRESSSPGRGKPPAHAQPLFHLRSALADDLRRIQCRAMAAAVTREAGSHCIRPCNSVPRHG